MKVSELITGPQGHPTHPPLTDAVIGLYTGAAGFAVLSALGVSEENLAIAWWLALVAGLVVTAPTVVTGFFEWLTITRGSPLWRTATAHMLSNAAATVFFLLAAIVGHGGYVDREVTTTPLVLTLIGYALLTLGGWLGGTVVFVHGMRVIKEKDRPAAQAIKPDAGTGGPGGRPREGLTRLGDGGS